MKKEEIEINHIQPITPLPEGYTQVNYLRAYNYSFDYIPYVNTNYNANNNTKMEIKFMMEMDYAWVFGGRTSLAVGDVFGLCYNFANNPKATTFAQFGNTESEVVQNISEVKNQEVVITMDVTGCFANGVQINNPQYNSNTWSSNHPIYLFNINNNGSTRNGLVGRIYYCKIWDNGAIVRNYIPAVRNSDNKPGFWDLAGSICTLTNTPFYVKAGGNGDFTWA